MSIRAIITSGLGGLARWYIKSQFGLADSDEGEPPIIPPQIPGNGIFKTPWSPLITGGLGTSACCGLLTGGVGSWQCFIGITPPDTGGESGGGGGSFAVHPGIYVPWPKHIPKKPGKRVVKITVKTDQKTWERGYIVDEKNANLTIRIITILNKTTAQLSVGVGKIQRAARSVKATFRNK